MGGIRRPSQRAELVESISYEVVKRLERVEISGYPLVVAVSGMDLPDA